MEKSSINKFLMAQAQRRSLRWYQVSIPAGVVTVTSLFALLPFTRVLFSSLKIYSGMGNKKRSPAFVQYPAGKAWMNEPGKG